MTALVTPMGHLFQPLQFGGEFVYALFQYAYADHSQKCATGRKQIVGVFVKFVYFGVHQLAGAVAICHKFAHGRYVVQFHQPPPDPGTPAQIKNPMARFVAGSNKSLHVMG